MQNKSEVGKIPHLTCFIGYNVRDSVFVEQHGKLWCKTALRFFNFKNSFLPLDKSESLCYNNKAHKKRRHGQAVRHRSAKPLSPGSNPGGASKTKSTARAVLFVLERCVPPRRNVMCPSGVMFASQVMCASRVIRNTSHHFAPKAQYITTACRNITLYKRSKSCYNISESEELLWLNLNSENYLWNFPLILLTLLNT